MRPPLPREAVELRLPSCLGRLPFRREQAAVLLLLVAAPVLVWLTCQKYHDPGVRAARLIGVVLATTFLAFSFSWPYYSLFLLPTFVCLASSRFEARGPQLLLFGAALYLLASPDYVGRFQAPRVTAGYFALLAALLPLKDRT